MARTQIIKIARSIQRELDQVQREGLKQARNIEQEIRRQANAAFRSRKKLKGIKKLVIKGLEPALLDAMQASLLLGIKRVKQVVDLRGVKFALKDTLARLERSIDVPDGVGDLIRSDAVGAIGDLAVALQEQIQSTIDKAILDGVTTRDGIARLAARFEELGIGAEGFQLETLFRTRNQIAQSAGQFAANQDEAVQEILWGYEYDAVLDDRVRPEHEALNGSRFPKGSPFWAVYWPPNGYNCRCTVLEIFKDESDARLKRPQKVKDGEVVSTRTKGATVPQPDPGFEVNPGQLLNTAS